MCGNSHDYFPCVRAVDVSVLLCLMYAMSVLCLMKDYTKMRH